MHVLENSITRWQTPKPLELVDLQVINSESGTLGVIEASKHIGFDARRMYFLTDLNSDSVRGAHAHKQLRQAIICVRGHVTLKVTKHDFSAEVVLNHYSKAAILQRGCWRELCVFSEDALVIVIASEEYKESDYIRNFEQFRIWEKQGALSDVPYLDLHRVDEEIGFEIRRAVSDVIESASYIGGCVLRYFEEKFSDYCHAKDVVGVANGLDALTLSLRAMGVGVGDEVIVPAHTFIATALAVTAVGATVVPVDVEYETGLIDVNKVEGAATQRTKAIIPVHLYGHPADMDPLLEIAARRGWHVLEDAAQAHGARYKGRLCGALGDAAGFSFYPTKNLGALGDGGAVVTSDQVLANRVRRLANYGSTQKYVHEDVGVNSRLDPMQAAVLLVKLRHIERWNARRRVLASRYLVGLREINGLDLPVVRPWAEPVWHVFAVKISDGKRDAVMQRLQAMGIGTNLHYPVSVTEQPCYAGHWNSEDYPNALRLARSLISLPLDPMHSDGEIDRVIATVKQVLAA